MNVFLDAAQTTNKHGCFIAIHEACYHSPQYNMYYANWSFIKYFSPHKGIEFKDHLTLEKPGGWWMDMKNPEERTLAEELALLLMYEMTKDLTVKERVQFSYLEEFNL